MKKTILAVLILTNFACEKQMSIPKNSITEEKGKVNQVEISLYKDNVFIDNAFIVIDKKAKVNVTEPISGSISTNWFQVLYLTKSDTVKFKIITNDIWCSQCQFDYSIVLKTDGVKCVLFDNGTPVSSNYNYKSIGDDADRFTLFVKK